MIRDCYTWRGCLAKARRTERFNTQKAIQVLIREFGSTAIERMDKAMLTEMVYRLMQEAGMDIQYTEAEQGVELWYADAGL